MGRHRFTNALRPIAAATAAVAAAAGVAACSSNSSSGDANLVAGKQLFVSKCGSCHTLSRAQTKGLVGPNLDEAFQQAVKDGLERDGIRGAVHGWILHPAIGGIMPAKLVTGDDAVDVAAYVATSVARGGKDAGLLATAVKQAGGGKPAVEKNGTIQIDADPTGQLAYVTNRGQAKAGSITVASQNKSGTGHDIVIDGKGAGKVVAGGGVSKFQATFRPGTYTFYCSVPGHREAGMVGKLTVK